MQEGKVNVIPEIPNHFERHLVTKKKNPFRKNNTIGVATAAVENVYISQIIVSNYQKVQCQLYPYNKGSFVFPQNIIAIPSFCLITP
jgi:ABC-2 type transport system permease protein